VDAVKGILNGTCNYILTEMKVRGAPSPMFLQEAQGRGYAEADPTLDVGGGDTAHKLALLASLAFGVAPDLNAVATSGIAHITRKTSPLLRSFGYRIKLLGIARRVGNKIDQKVQPAMVRVRSRWPMSAAPPTACWWMQARRFPSSFQAAARVRHPPPAR